jgi:hypothetical protein
MKVHRLPSSIYHARVSTNLPLLPGRVDDLGLHAVDLLRQIQMLGVQLQIQILGVQLQAMQ